MASGDREGQGPTANVLPPGRDSHSGWSAALAYTAAALILLAALILVSGYSFVVFHSLAELFTIVIALGVGMVAWNARRYLDNDYVLFVGLTGFFVAFIDLLHLLGYKGMGVFPQGGPNLSTQLWIAGRYVSSFSLLVAPLFLRRRIPLFIVLPAFTVTTVALIASIFSGHFPTCFDDGLTRFKIVSEVIICAMFVAAAILLSHGRRWLDARVMNLILASIVIRIVAEICFALYGNVYDAVAFTGHYLRIIAFFLLYKAILETGITRPFAILMRDLRQRENDLRSSLQELESFAFSVSHDLRSPLSAISGFAQLIEWNERDRLSQEGREYVAQIRAASRRMGDLIDDLLSFSRASRAELEIEKVDVTALAAEVAQTLRHQDAARQVEIVMDDGMVGKGDARMLRVVLENLLANAWKFTSKHERARIEIRARRADDENLFLVRDDGAGFDMTRAPGRLFRPFQRLHTSADFEGTGIGLATVSRIIERHGGRVWAESEVEKGTTVYFTLPDEEKASAADDQPPGQ